MATAVHDAPKIAEARRKRDALDALFAPNNITVIGASESLHSVGRAVVENLTVFPGTVHLVNPNHSTIFGKRTFANVTDIPDSPDLAVIATPAKAVPQIIRSCVEAGIPAALILSAGFKECGAQGLELETQVLSEPAKAAACACWGLIVSG